MFTKLEFIHFLLFVNNAISEDWSLCKKFAVYILKPFWFIRSILVVALVIATFPVLYPVHYYTRKIVNFLHDNFIDVNSNM